MPVMPIHSPIVKVNQRGLMFSREAIDLLGLVPESRIIIDKEVSNSTNLYVRIVGNAEIGFPFKFQNKRFFVYSRPLARSIRTCLGIKEGEVATFRLGEPQKNHLGERVVPIITRINYDSRN